MQAIQELTSSAYQWIDRLFYPTPFWKGKKVALKTSSKLEQLASDIVDQIAAYLIKQDPNVRYFKDPDSRALFKTAKTFALREAYGLRGRGDIVSEMLTRCRSDIKKLPPYVDSLFDRINKAMIEFLDIRAIQHVPVETLQQFRCLKTLLANEEFASISTEFPTLEYVLVPSPTTSMLQKLPNLTTLDFEKSLSPLSALTKLRFFSCNRWFDALSVQEFEILGKCENLETLALNADILSTISNEMLEKLAPLSRLRHLSIRGGSPLQQRDLGTIATNHPKLEKLHIYLSGSDTSINFRIFALLQNLSYLSIDKDGMTREELEAIGESIPQITHLKLHLRGPTKSDIALLKPLQKLTSFDIKIDEAEDSGAVIQELAHNHPNLKRLSINVEKIPSEALFQLTSLQYLSVSTQLTASQSPLTFIQKLPNLEELSISQFPNPDLENLMFLPYEKHEPLPFQSKLKSLCLEFCTFHTKMAHDLVAGAPHLQFLSLVGCDIITEHPELPFEFPPSKKLTFLDVHKSIHIDEIQAEVFARNYPNLQKISCHETTSEKAYEVFAQSLPHLQEVVERAENIQFEIPKRHEILMSHGIRVSVDHLWNTPKSFLYDFEAASLPVPR
jgi:hypothetical protein